MFPRTAALVVDGNILSLTVESSALMEVKLNKYFTRNNIKKDFRHRLHKYTIIHFCNIRIYIRSHHRVFTFKITIFGHKIYTNTYVVYNHINFSIIVVCKRLIYTSNVKLK